MLDFLAQIVDCSGSGCDLGELVTTGARLINYIRNIATIVATVFVLWGGFILLTSGGSSERVSKGKKILWAAIIGLVIVWGAWFIINIIIDTFANCSGDWFDPGGFDCG